MLNVNIDHMSQLPFPLQLENPLIFFLSFCITQEGNPGSQSQSRLYQKAPLNVCLMLQDDSSNSAMPCLVAIRCSVASWAACSQTSSCSKARHTFQPYHRLCLSLNSTKFYASPSQCPKLHLDHAFPFLKPILSMHFL